MAADNATTETTEDEPAALVEIREQFERVHALRQQVKDGTRRLAEMIAATRDNDDPRVHPTAAARAMGTAKTYPHELIGKLEAGKL